MKTASELKTLENCIAELEIAEKNLEAINEEDYEAWDEACDELTAIEIKTCRAIEAFTGGAIDRMTGWRMVCEKREELKNLIARAA